MQDSATSRLIETAKDIFGPTARVEFLPIEGGYQRIFIFDISNGKELEKLSGAVDAGDELDYNDLAKKMIDKILTSNY